MNINDLDVVLLHHDTGYGGTHPTDLCVPLKHFSGMTVEQTESMLREMLIHAGMKGDITAFAASIQETLNGEQEEE